MPLSDLVFLVVVVFLSEERRENKRVKERLQVHKR